VKKHSIIFIVIIVSLLFSFIFSNWGLTETSEARYAQISKEMFTSKDYLHPTLLGIHHFHKPPVTYYITCMGYALFGINETGVRFFLLLALLLQLWLLYRITYLFYNNRDTALAAMLFYFSYPVVQAATKNLTTDAYLTTFIFAAIYSFINYRQKQRAIYIYLFYFFCGLAFLTKGPVGLIPQFLFSIGYSRTFPVAKPTGIHHYIALLTGVAVCASWFIVLVIDDPGLLNYFLQHQLADRVASNSFNRTQPWWYYLMTMPLLGLPAFIYFIEYCGNRVLAKKQSSSSGFIMISFMIALLIFSISASKLVLYVLPLYLFVAMLSADHLLHMRERSKRIIETIGFIFSCLLIAAIITGCFIPLPVYIPPMPVLPMAITAVVISSIIYFKRVPVPVLKGPILNAVLMIFLLLTLPFIMKKNELQINSVKPVAALINAGSKQNGRIAVYDYLLPSLAFYTHQKITTIDNGNNNTHREIQFEEPGRAWEENYIKISGLTDSNRNAILLSKRFDCIIARMNNDLPDSLAFLKAHLLHRSVMGKWVIYH
jgi:4-amino-4-deoxy-L-arabinose transferase-like glycosyltransferase